MLGLRNIYIHTKFIKRGGGRLFITYRANLQQHKIWHISCVYVCVHVCRNTYTRRSRGWCFQTECWASGGAGHKHNALTSAAECSGRRQTCSSPGRSWKQNHTENSFDCFWVFMLLNFNLLTKWMDHQKNKYFCYIVDTTCTNMQKCLCKTFCLVYHFNRPNWRQVLQIWTKSQENTIHGKCLLLNGSMVRQTICATTCINDTIIYFLDLANPSLLV